MRRLRRSWPALRWVITVVLLGASGWIVAGQSSELSGVGVFLDRVRWSLIAVGVVAEVISYAGFAAVQKRLLASGDTPVRLPRVAVITLAGNSIQTVLPAGPVIAAAFAFRQFRRLGASDLLAGWVVVATTAVSFVTLAVLAGVGLAAAASAGSALDLVGAILATLAGAAALAGLWTARSRLRRPAIVALGWYRRLRKQPPGEPARTIDDVVERLAAVAPTRADWLTAGLFSTVNWVADCSCLALAYAAVGADVPWRGLLLAYAGAQLATNLPITPGGLGVVEGSLTVALVAFGGAEESTVAAVLLYRLLSFWMPIPAGGISYLGLRLTERRAARTLGGTGRRPGQALPSEPPAPPDPSRRSTPAPTAPAAAASAAAASTHQAPSEGEQ